MIFCINCQEEYNRCICDNPQFELEETIPEEEYYNFTQEDSDYLTDSGEGTI